MKTPHFLRIAMALATVAAFSAISPSSGSLQGGVSAGSALPGDANCDGVVNVVDAALMLQVGAGLIGGLPCQSNGDVSGDGTIDALDAALVLQFAAGLIDTLGPSETSTATASPTHTPQPPTSTRPPTQTQVPTQTPLPMPPTATATPISATATTEPASPTLYLGSDLEFLDGDVEVIVSDDGRFVESFTIERLCRIGEADTGRGLFVWGVSLQISSVAGSFQWSNSLTGGSYKVHGAFSADRQSVTGQVWLKAPCVSDPIDWVAYAQ